MLCQEFDLKALEQMEGTWRNVQQETYIGFQISEENSLH